MVKNNSKCKVEPCPDKSSMNNSKCEAKPCSNKSGMVEAPVIVENNSECAQYLFM